MNSARYIDLILSYYSSLDIPTTVFVDSKTIDNTSAIAERYARVVPIENQSTTSEGIIDQIAYAVQSEFVLRMDDDELPSIDMMNFVKSAVQQEGADAYGFPLRQCAVSIEGTLLSHIDHSDIGDKRHWRLFRPAKVRFTKRIHTPGIEVEGLHRIAAPYDACMIHLDWALHSYEQRRAKVQRYDAHTPGAGSYFRSYYLYEEVPLARQRFQSIDLPEFKSITHEILERFGELCVPHRARIE
jgi:hypothetical protein